MVNCAPLGKTETRERLSRARTACRDLMEAFSEERSPYTMAMAQLFAQEADA